MKREAKTTTFQIEAVYSLYPTKSKTVDAVLKHDGADTNGLIYSVAMEGEIIGHIKKAMATFERAPKGSRIVTRRWRSLRWFAFPLFSLRCDFRSYRHPRETRKGAVKELVEAVLRHRVSPTRAAFHDETGEGELG